MIQKVIQCHLLDRLGNPTGSTIDPVCHHYSYLHLLPVTIEMKEYLCVSCYGCRKIMMLRMSVSSTIGVVLSSYITSADHLYALLLDFGYFKFE